MELIVRAVDVGSGNTKFVTGMTGAEIRCGSFPSVAYPSSGDIAAWPTTDRRKTTCIPVGPLYYEVGPDVGLAADTFRAKQLHDEYTESPEYMALLRGALSMMKVPHVDLLVVGLPVALLALKKASLEKAMTGSHPIGGGRSIMVHKALAVAQPQGALVHYAAEHQKMTTIGNEQSLGQLFLEWCELAAHCRAPVLGRLHVSTQPLGHRFARQARHARNLSLALALAALEPPDPANLVHGDHSCTPRPLWITRAG